MAAAQTRGYYVTMDLRAGGRVIAPLEVADYYPRCPLFYSIV
jgi:hypothetical protein